MTDEAASTDPGPNDLVALRRAIEELRDSELDLAAARARLDHPQLVMEIERLVDERRKALDGLVQSLGEAPSLSESRVVSGIETGGPTPSRPKSVTAGEVDSIVPSLVCRETSTISSLRKTLRGDLPDPVEHALRSALTQVGRSRDQLQLVGP